MQDQGLTKDITKEKNKGLVEFKEKTKNCSGFHRFTKPIFKVCRPLRFLLPKLSHRVDINILLLHFETLMEKISLDKYLASIKI